MHYEKYNDIVASSNFLEYQFTSVGPKGNIPKIIQFIYNEDLNVYNLAFGNRLSDGTIDDTTTNNNNDRNKILATVVAAVYKFCEKFPYAWIFFTGSTLQRTRLYRMAISINYQELSIDFEILGMLKDLDSFVYVPFQKEIDYFGFFIRRKKP